MSGGTLLDQLAAKAAPAVEAQAVKWTAYLVDALEQKLMPSVPAALQGAVAAAIGKVKDNEALVGQTTAHGFTALLAHLALGREDEARLVWLSSSADFDADMSALDDAYKATRADVKSKAETWATVREIALGVLEAAGAKLFPILLGLA